MPNDLHDQYFQNNNNLSYFVGVSASIKSPRSLLGGDRNLGGSNAPDSEFGFSPTNGKGNDVAVPIAGPVAWSLKMHSDGKPVGAGNILFGDGSVQQVSSASFNKNLLRNVPPTTKWPAGHVPATPSIRLVFP
jgi:prepilin-type processing-associated H-X9-DG protein